MAFNKIQHMLLGIAIGDAFGASYEFAYKKRKNLEENLDFTKYKAHPNKKFKHAPGRYTDDTQMSIAIAELLSEDKEFNHENLADQFVKCYKRDPINGYAKGFGKLLNSVDSGKEFIKRIKPNSEKNGAAMRAVPLGTLPDLENVIKYAKINAETTHKTPKGIASSVTVALLSHLHFTNMHKQISIFDYIKKSIKKIDRESAKHFELISKTKKEEPELLFGRKHALEGICNDGMRTVGGVLYILSHYENPKEVLKQSVLLGGDTDSVASIALGISLMNNNLDELPKFLLSDLTNHRYGRDYIINLGDKLSKKYAKQKKQEKTSAA